MYVVIVDERRYVSYIRFAGGRCEAYGTSFEDSEAVRLPWARAVAVAERSGGRLQAVTA